MDIQLKHNMCLLCGDIHADVELWFKEVERLGGFTDTDIIILGDIGIGFYYLDDRDMEYKRYNDREWLKELDFWAKTNNNDIWVFRGNHDDPQYFTRDNVYWDFFDNVHLLTEGDFVISKNGKRYIVVPGSISIDRKGLHRMLGMSYWDDEYIRYGYFTEIEDTKVDGVLAHTGPTPPACLKSDAVYNWSLRDENLEDDIDKERTFCDYLIRKFKPTHWFNGHYHEQQTFEHQGVTVHALGICKFLELDRYE